jgi:hypothetical protein
MDRLRMAMAEPVTSRLPRDHGQLGVLASSYNYLRQFRRAGQTVGGCAASAAVTGWRGYRRRRARSRPCCQRARASGETGLMWQGNEKSRWERGRGGAGQISSAPGERNILGEATPPTPQGRRPVEAGACPSHRRAEATSPNLSRSPIR